VKIMFFIAFLLLLNLNVTAQELLYYNQDSDEAPCREYYFTRINKLITVTQIIYNKFGHTIISEKTIKLSKMDTKILSDFFNNPEFYLLGNLPFDNSKGANHEPVLTMGYYNWNTRKYKFYKLYEINLNTRILAQHKRDLLLLLKRINGGYPALWF
jgi:hypothetical protein